MRLLSDSILRKIMYNTGMSLSCATFSVSKGCGLLEYLSRNQTNNALHEREFQNIFRYSLVPFTHCASRW